MTGLVALGLDELAVRQLAAFLPLSGLCRLARCSQRSRHLSAAGVRCVNLVALDIAEPQVALGQLLSSSLCEHGAVRELAATFCVWVNNATLRSLPKMPDLQVLVLDGCQEIDDDGLLAVGQRCPHLRCFSLYWNVKVTDKGLCRVLKAQRGHHLKSLNFSGCKYLTDETVQRILTKAPELEELDLTRCPQVTEGGIQLVFECLDKLRVLRLYAMAQLNPNGFSSLHKLLHLEELDLCGCRIEDAAFVSFVEACTPSRLHTLNLTWCPALTDLSLRALTSCCPRLEWLSLFGNLNMTEAAIEDMAIAPCSRTLRWLDIRGMTGAPELTAQAALPQTEALSKLRRIFPILERTDLHH